MAAHERKRFAEKVDYVTRPGYLEGGKARERYHFIGEGPVAVITTLGILRPDPVTKEFMLDAWFAFSGIEEMKANTRLGSERISRGLRRSGTLAPGA